MQTCRVPFRCLRREELVPYAPPSTPLADRLALMGGTEVELTRRLALDFGRLQATLCRG